MILVVESPTKKFLSFLERKKYKVKVLITRNVPFTTEKTIELIEISDYEWGNLRN